MSDPLSASAIRPLDLEPIKAREAAATSGPWRVVERDDDNGDEETWVDFNGGDDSSLMQRQDAAFIAHARADIPALLAEVERLRSSVAAKEPQA